MKFRPITLLYLLLAHHSMAMFDVTKTITYVGSVTRFSYTNPHIYVYADIQKDGQKVNYRVEGGAPYGLKDQGWSSTVLQVGDKITIQAHPAKDNTNFGLLMSITKANGAKLGSGPPQK